MKRYKYNAKPITKAKCSECGKKKATGFYKTRPVCTECYLRLTYHRGYVPKGQPAWIEKLLEAQRNERRF
jgi:uncharacterized protein (DUF983 family)